MSKFKIPGVSFSRNRALGITQAKQNHARKTDIPTYKAGLERKNREDDAKCHLWEETMSTSCILYACYYKARGYCCTHIIKNQRNNMQKFIRIALPCVCFAVIIWWCCFNGFQYINWKWLILAAGIGGICIAALYVKLHKMLGKREAQRKKQMEEAIEAVAPELEKVKGNSLKKELVKRRMVREYLEKNTDYYAKVDDNDAIRKVQNWISSVGWSIYLLILPFGWIIVWGIILLLLALLFYWSFLIQMAICCAFSIAASIILVWQRNYVLAPIAIGLAAILLYGLFNAGLDGVEMPAFHMVLENEGNIFLSPSHAEDTMWGSSVMLSITSIGLTVYPWLKKKTLVMCAILVFLVVEVIRYGVHMNMTLTIPTSYLYYPYVLSCAVNADLAVMLGISYNAAFIVIFVYLAWLFPVIFALPAFIRSWKGMGELKERSPLYKKAKYRRLYYVCLAWLIMNALATALVWGRLIGISTEECASILVKNTQYLSGVTGIVFFATNLIVYCAPILTSALFSWILFAITKRQIKLKDDIS